MAINLFNLQNLVLFINSIGLIIRSVSFIIIPILFSSSISGKLLVFISLAALSSRFFCFGLDTYILSKNKHDYIKLKLIFIIYFCLSIFLNFISMHNITFLIVAIGMLFSIIHILIALIKVNRNIILASVFLNFVIPIIIFLLILFLKFYSEIPDKNYVIYFGNNLFNFLIVIGISLFLIVHFKYINKTKYSLWDLDELRFMFINSFIPAISENLDSIVLGVFGLYEVASLSRILSKIKEIVNLPFLSASIYKNNEYRDWQNFDNSKALTSGIKTAVPVQSSLILIFLSVFLYFINDHYQILISHIHSNIVIIIFIQIFIIYSAYFGLTGLFLVQKGLSKKLLSINFVSLFVQLISIFTIFMFDIILFLGLSAFIYNFVQKALAHSYITNKYKVSLSLL